jgi:hypothetical protein
MKLGSLVGAVLLGGCVSYTSSVPPVVINVTTEGEACRVTVAPDPFNHPLEFTQVHQDQLRQIASKTTSRRAVVIYDLKAQYKCIGSAIITAQQAGLVVDAVPWNGR